MYSDKTGQISISIVSGIGKKSGKPYTALRLQIGNDNLAIVRLIFLPSPRDYAYVKEILGHVKTQ